MVIWVFMLDSTSATHQGVHQRPRRDLYRDLTQAIFLLHSPYQPDNNDVTYSCAKKIF